jgi:hypothetical protein
MAAFVVQAVMGLYIGFRQFWKMSKWNAFWNVIPWTSFHSKGLKSLGKLMSTGKYTNSCFQKYGWEL